MRDIWNPWHGCVKKSEGCQNCYMYSLDEQRGKSGADIFCVKNNFDYPLHKNKYGDYKIKSGEFIRVCMTSDFFLEEADEWRKKAWEIMKIRSDVVFILVTKRPERIEKCLPSNWEDGWNNIWLNVTTENQIRADERAPILLDLPFKHKGFLVAPFIGEVSLKKYLNPDQIDNVWCCGENYTNARPLYYSWVEKLSNECKAANVSFSFSETGDRFIKNNQIITPRNKAERMKYAFLQNLNYESTRQQIFDIQKPVKQFSLFDTADEPINKYFKEQCNYCVRKKLCAGCSNCGRCDNRF